MRPFHGHHMNADELKKTRVDRAKVFRAWQFGKPYKKLLVGYIVTAFLTSFYGVLPPLVFRRFIDHTIPARDLSEVNLLAIALIVLTIANSALGVLTRWMSTRLGEGVIADTRKALYDHVQRMPIAFFTRTQTGALMSRVNNDVVGAQQAFTFVLRSVLINLLTVIFTVTFMIALAWQVAVAALFTVPLLIWVSKKVGKLQGKAAREQMRINAEMNTVMTERFNVSGAMLVKLFGRPVNEAEDFDAKADAVAAAGVRRVITGAPFMLLLNMVGALGTAGVYWWGVRAVIAGSLKLGTVVALAAYLQRLWDPMVELASARVDFLTAFVSFERIFEVLDAPHSIADSPTAKPIPAPPVGRVTVDHLSFRYPAPSEVSVASLETGGLVLSHDPSALVLHDVSFTAEPGTMTALVGPSGAGKTTLAQLVPRLYDATDGSIRIDGLDVRDVTLTSLRDTIGVVTQDAHLFHDTIGNNLRYAKPEATADELVAACRAAQIHEMIAGLPDGYDTMVGERGYRLSGGEKARVAIARVLLKNPKVVILDEATAHLDSETESQIQLALDTALTGRTSLVIAHRLSTVQAADQILVIEAGRIVERGTHEQLVSDGGLYADLYETQYLRTADSVA